MIPRKLLLALTLVSAALIFPAQAAPIPVGTPRLPLPQTASAPPAPAAPGPLLKIDDTDPAAAKAVALESLDLAIVLSGPLSQTTVTMTFRNNLNRPLEGELEFPLPQGAAIVGYALDVPAGSGLLVEGVAVEKERARQIFESEVRRGIDPGIVEQTRGNNYRTRVHPIPAAGTRTIQLTFTADLAADAKTATYKLPLDFTGNLKSAKIRIEALGVAKPDDLHVDGLPNLTFAPQNGRLVAEKTFANIALTGTLAITQPLGDAVYAAVESRTHTPSLDNPSPVTHNYFFISALIKPPINAEVARPGTIALLWDTNLSRAGTDKSAEIAAVKSLLAQLKTVKVLLLTTTDPTPREFPITAGNSDALLKAIDALTYDGALRIDQTLLAGLADDKSDTQPRTARTDLALFITNGLVSLGENRFANFVGSHAPVYTLSADAQADHALLQRLAEETGGIYLNLQRMKPADAVSAITEPALLVSLSEGDTTKVVLQQVYPAGEVRVRPGQRVTFTGELHANEKKVFLSTRIAGGPVSTQEIMLTLPPAATREPAAGIIPRFWAQQKAAYLSADEKNADQLLTLAKDFNLVTSRTSLMVLETVDQYLRYRIVPPKSRTEIYQQFAQRIEQEGKDANKVKQEKIDHILALWKQRVDWWNTKFDVPTKEAIALAQRQEEARNLPAVIEGRPADASGGIGGVSTGGYGGGYGGGGYGAGGGLGGTASPSPPCARHTTREHLPSKYQYQ